MRFVGRVAIILIVVFGAAVAHSMVWPITNGVPDARDRRAARSVVDGVSSTQGQPPEATDQDSEASGDGGETPAEPDNQGADPDAAPPTPVVDSSDADLPDYYVSVARAFELWDEGMPFLDARTDAERVVGTVEGAFHLETKDFIGIRADQVLAQVDPAFPVVIFCAGGECDASENVAQRLIGRGYAEVYIMHEGFGAWEAAGHPTEPVGGG